MLCSRSELSLDTGRQRWPALITFPRVSVIRKARQGWRCFIDNSSIDSIDMRNQLRPRRMVSKPFSKQSLCNLGCDRRMTFANLFSPQGYKPRAIMLPMMLVAMITTIIKPIPLLKHSFPTYRKAPIMT